MASSLTLRLQSEADSLSEHPTETKIRSYSRRGRGWHYGEGVEFCADVVAEAISLHRFIVRNGHYRTDAFPGLGGEVIVTLYHGSHYYEFALEPGGQLWFSHEVGGEEKVYRAPISVDKAYQIIKQIRTDEWSSSESSLASTMTSTFEDFRAGFLAIRETMVAYLSSVDSAWSRPPATFAVTSGGTTPTSEVAVQSSGSSRQAICPVTAN